MATTTSTWPTAADNLDNAGDPGIAVERHADSINAIQADLAKRGATSVSKRTSSSPTISSGAAWQNTAPHDVTVSVKVATAGTVEIQLISNAATPVTITLESARTVAASGSPNIVVNVPAGWSLKLTATTTVLGTAFVY